MKPWHGCHGMAGTSTGIEHRARGQWEMLLCSDDIVLFIRLLETCDMSVYAYWALLVTYNLISLSICTGKGSFCKVSLHTYLS